MRSRMLLVVVLAAGLFGSLSPVSSAPQAGAQAGAGDHSGFVRLDLRVASGVPLAMPDPTHIEEGIGPGSQIHIRFSETTGNACTANFVFTDALDRLYLGTAGHCLFSDGRKRSTHGADADFDASTVSVLAWAGSCLARFSVVVFSDPMCLETGKAPELVALGEVVYARQRNGDFGLIRIPESVRHLVRTQLPQWGGPHGTSTMRAGDIVLHYGHGGTFDATSGARGRVAVGLGSVLDVYFYDAFYALGTANFGDSGSPVVRGDGMDGVEALGVLTGALPPLLGILSGPHIGKIKRDLFCDAGLRVWVVPGDSPVGSVTCPIRTP